jgi:hypothetical protein
LMLRSKFRSRKAQSVEQMAFWREGGEKIKPLTKRDLNSSIHRY